MKYITLSGEGGYQMPVVGLGTWRAMPEEVEHAVLTALDLGYRHIDTAFNYNNEEVIGSVLQKWLKSGKGKREDLFITTKLPHVGNRAEDVERFLKMSLERLQLEYVDLYLIHMPFAFICNEHFTPVVLKDGSFLLDKTNNNIDTWKAMEDKVRNGLIKSIGLSNFNAEQVRNIYNSADIKPSVLQVEMHAYMQQKQLRAICKELDIAITAYAPLGSPGADNHFSSKYSYVLADFPDILSNPMVEEIANRHGKTPGQIILRHLIQYEIIIIPKSKNPKRLEENITLFDFEISEEDMGKLDNLDKGDDGRIFDFLFFKGVQNHPQYPFKIIS